MLTAASEPCVCCLPQEIKAAYRALTKVCHVDIAGDNEANRNMCIVSARWGQGRA